MNRRFAVAVFVGMTLAAHAQGPAFSGSVPEAAGTGPKTLTLQEAIRLGLKNNLGGLIAGEDERFARGQRIIALSQLLPFVGARVSETANQINLAAFGFSPPAGTPKIVGPFSLFDARFVLSQSLFNMQNLRHAKAGDENIRATALESQNARDTVVLVVTALYLDALAGSGRVTAAEARVKTAQALYDQAVSFKQAGVVAGIDVLRAEVQLRAQRQKLIAFKNEFEKQKLRLGRAIGVTGDNNMQLADPMPAATGAAALPKVDEAIQQAYVTRTDYRGLQSRVKAAELERSSVAAQRIPTLAFNGDYGTLGKSPTNSHGTFAAGVTLRIPMFDGNRIKGQELEADAEIAKLKAQLADLRGRIEFDIRNAELDLQAATDQLEVARGAVELARKQEEQARDRFAAGVTSNLEVVQAQESVAAADEDLISSLLATNLAKAALARAIGASEKNIPAFLMGAK